MQIQLAFLASTVLFLPVAQVALGAQTPVTNAWQAKVGASGVNGTARISITNGVGSIGLTLVRLRPASTLPVALYKGTCASVGAVLFRLASIKTTSTGAASRTNSLTAAQVKLILAATAGSGRIALRVGSSTARCGAFAKAVAPIYEAVASQGGPFGGEFGLNRLRRGLCVSTGEEGPDWVHGRGRARRRHAGSATVLRGGAQLQHEGRGPGRGYEALRGRVLRQRRDRGPGQPLSRR